MSDSLRWGLWWPGYSAVFWTFMAVWLLVDPGTPSIAGRLLGIMFLTFGIIYWILLGAWWACEEYTRHLRMSKLRRHLISKPPCLTFCHNAGMPIMPEEDDDEENPDSRTDL